MEEKESKAKMFSSIGLMILVPIAIMCGILFFSSCQKMTADQQEMIMMKNQRELLEKFIDRDEQRSKYRY